MSPPGRATNRPTGDLWKLCFIAVLAVWILTPLAATGGVAEDAIPYVVAGRLLPHHPSDVYASRSGDVHDLEPRFAADYCRIAGISGETCRQYAVAYVSTPLALPFAALLGHTSAFSGSLVMRLAAALLLAAGMALLYGRLAHRTPRARPLLLMTAILLTPMALAPIAYGQTSPVLFLSVCLGIGSTRRGRTIWNAAAWLLAVTFKGFPAALAVPLAWRRRWRILGIAGAGLVALSALTLAIAPASVVHDFLSTSSRIGGQGANSLQQSSLSAVLRSHAGGSPVAGWIGSAVAAAAAALLCVVGMRGVDDDTRWGVGYLALLLVSPVVWWHYLWVAVGALGVTLAGLESLDDRALAILPVAALLTLPPSWPTNPSPGTMPVYQATFLVGTAVAVGVLASAARRQHRKVPMAGLADAADG